MRIPKFRAWDKVERKMIEDVASIHFKSEMIVTRNLCFYPFKDIELMQSTGLFDKNGKEIFEGDIVKDTDGYVGYIAFLKQEMGYVIVYKTYDKRLGHRYRLDDGHLEILGNIYEHQYLLGED
ncbi:YopX family protein [Mammaliicoccus sciuri]|uniref:YopX family protein n=1 Tax=Mammaliicoccus sciuri TaxID=1296 RepID=UPI0021D23658|nr:YopX family protein [Mammaliicoccus sciuri]UXU70221.1 YopX family protein [Mammaliicoccus sciuri]